MRMNSRNRQPIFIANRIDQTDDYGNAKYKQPFKLILNLAPVNGESEIKEYGERVSNMYKSIVDRFVYEGKMYEYDVAYLDGARPDEEVVYGSNANYRVESIRKTRNTMVIYFMKL